MAKAAFNLRRDRPSVKWAVKLMDGKKDGFQQRPEDGPKRPVHESQGSQMELEMKNIFVGDITQRKRLEDALKNSETRLRQSSQIILAHEGERRKISQELQDSILSKLSVINSELEEKITLLGKESSAERLELEKLKSVASRGNGRHPKNHDQSVPLLFGPIDHSRGEVMREAILWETDDLAELQNLSAEVGLKPGQIAVQAGIWLR